MISPFPQEALSGAAARPIILHIMHDLGGGGQCWLEDFIAADPEHTHLVLKQHTHSQASSDGVALYCGADLDMVLGVWRFDQAIFGTEVTHIEYLQLLMAIIDAHVVSGIIVSSLIGHTLDALRTSLPTLIVNHDYFPFCPAVNIFFNGICTNCDQEKLARCKIDNHDFDAFPGFPVERRLEVREEFVRIVTQRPVPMVVPSASVARHLCQLEPRFNDAQFHLIPHGRSKKLPWIDLPPKESSHRLVVLILGQISPAKGADLLMNALPRLTAIADVFILGGQELARRFESLPHVQVLSRYLSHELPGHVAAIRPDIGLLLSVVPETFSYTLSELWDMGIPPVATRVGGFADRIRHGENGFLFDPDAHSLLALLTTLDDKRTMVDKVRNTLKSLTFRSSADMTAEYYSIFQMIRKPNLSSELATTASTLANHPDLLLADMWKEVKSLSLQLNVTHELLRRVETENRDLENRARVMDEKSKHQTTTIEELRSEVIHSLEQCSTKDVLLSQFASSNEALLNSTSWRVMAPLRWGVTRARNLHKIVVGLHSILAQPGERRSLPERIYRSWQSGGWLGIKRSLARVAELPVRSDLWQDYQTHIKNHLLPILVAQEAAMDLRPLISVIVPTYNTPEGVFMEMLNSVKEQIYRNWELCIVDDCSPDSKLKHLLQQVAENDPRIRVEFCEKNGGVAQASNRAIAMARGSHVVLLDHDDCLEPHALLRVAQTICSRDPDMFYSDEALFSEDMQTLKTLALRPAFSPEYLRGHPYFVHLSGFRTSLLRDIGGFNESLRISQDYDLFLRATERANSIAHISEILYRWRIHHTSAGHQMMDQVMERSKAILQSHLDRCNTGGTITDGPSFNFFDTRYELADNHRVAIVIPTKNHGPLVRQCIESILRTVHSTSFDIVLIDHESDDPVSIAYFNSLSNPVRVLRYEGPFNFSAINNWAVSKIKGPYSHYLFCNNDIEAIEDGWLERMLELGQRPDVGIVGALLTYPDKITVQHAGVCIGAFGKAEHYGKFMTLRQGKPPEIGYNGQLGISREVSAVTAACMLMKSEAFEEVGGYDEALAVGFGDTDLCLRAGQAGWRTLYCAHAKLVHHESMSRGTNNLHPEDTALFTSRWKDLLAAGDPYYNPNLSLTSTQWEFRNPLATDPLLKCRIYRKKHHGRQQVI